MPISLEDHPIANIFPLLPENELRELAEDIQANQLQVPIVLFEGKILDGRNRYRAAQMVGAHVTTNYYTGESPTAHVISLNLKRRQLNAGQKAAVAVDAMPHFEAEAKARQGARSDIKEIIPEGGGQARDKAAEVTGANPRYVQDAKKLKAESPEVFEKVRAGSMTIPEAKKALKAEANRAPSIIKHASGVIADLSEVAGQKFGCIYADPPWRYGNQATRAATDNHYDTMTVDEICALPVRDLAADQSHLHLWTTNAFLFECPRIFEAWGFEYKSTFIWVKPQMGIGNYWRCSHEILLLGVRGGLTARDRGQMSWVQCSRGRHSSKPDIVRDRIAKLSPGPYLEMFGRSKHEGWTVFGNQVGEGEL